MLNVVNGFRKIFHRHPPEPVASSVIDAHFVLHRGSDVRSYIEANDMNAVHHILHYMWACKAVRTGARAPDSILDVACGSGFGSHMLAEAFPACSIF